MDATYFTKRNFAILILVDLFDHLFQAEMRLWNAHFFQHEFQFVEIQIFVPIGIVPESIDRLFDFLFVFVLLLERLHQTLNLFACKLGVLGIGIEDR